MNIRLVISPTDPDVTDGSHYTGLTSEGYKDLVHALTSAGFELVDGPEAER